MTDYFVIGSGGSDVNGGLSFDDGFATIKKGMDTVAGSANRLFIDDGVKEDYTTAASVSWTGNTLSSPTRVTSVDSTSAATSGTNGDAFTYSPMPQTITSHIFDFGYTQNGGATFTLTLNGFWSIRGVNFGCVAADFVWSTSNVTTKIFEDLCLGCAFQSNGALEASNPGGIILNNVNFYLGHINTKMQFSGGGTLVWRGGGIHASSAASTGLFHDLHNGGCTIVCDSLDFSACATGAQMLGDNTTNGYLDVLFSRCLFSTAPTFDDWTINSSPSQVRVYACAYGSDDTIGEVYEYGITGTTVDETTTVGLGTIDGSTGYSLKMTPSTSSREGVRPLRTLLGSMAIATNAVVKVKTTCDTELDNSQFWIEAHVPDSTNEGLTNIETTKGTVLSPTTIPTDASSPWTSPKTYEQVTTLTLSGNVEGNALLFAYAAVEAGNVDIYVDPEPVLSPEVTAGTKNQVSYNGMYRDEDITGRNVIGQDGIYRIMSSSGPGGSPPGGGGVSEYVRRCRRKSRR